MNGIQNVVVCASFENEPPLIVAAKDGLDQFVDLIPLLDDDSSSTPVEKRVVDSELCEANVISPIADQRSS